MLVVGGSVPVNVICLRILAGSDAVGSSASRLSSGLVGVLVLITICCKDALCGSASASVSWPVVLVGAVGSRSVVVGFPVVRMLVAVACVLRRLLVLVNPW